MGRAADPHGFKGGDLYGVVERLDELAELGVTALYLTPIFASASNHRYHAYDYLTVDPLLGGDAALRELLDAAHGRGIRVILDGVFNHCGRGFWPFHHVDRERAASRRTATGSISTRTSSTAERGLNAYPDRGGPPGHDAPAGYRAWWGMPALPKLNVENPPDARVPLGRRRALAPVRDRRLAARRPGRDRGPDVLAGVPPALPGDRPDGLPRRRDLGRGARVARTATASTR